MSINDGEDISYDDGEGVLSGEAGSGTIDYSRGRILLTPLSLPTDTIYTVTARTGPARAARMRSAYQVGRSQ